MSSTSRNGILAGGNFIIDHVKIIDEYPAENMLATILEESSSNGGGPYNVLRDLSAMGVSFPREAAGLVIELKLAVRRRNRFHRHLDLVPGSAAQPDALAFEPVENRIRIRDR